MMLESEDFQTRVEARVLDMKDCVAEQDVELLAAEARGYVSAAREFEIIAHDDFKKATADIEQALTEWRRSRKTSKA